MSTTTLVTTALHDRIEVLAAVYSKKRERVTTIVNDLEDEVRKVHRRYRLSLNLALSDAEAAQQNLRAEVEAHPEAFVKPRTWTLHGIEIGYKKGRGKTTWEDEDAVIEKLRKRFGDLSDEVERCVEIKESLVADQLRELPAKDLAALGVTIEDTGDVVFVRAKETDTDKLVKRLLKEGARAVAEEGGES